MDNDKPVDVLDRQWISVTDVLPVQAREPYVVIWDGEVEIAGYDLGRDKRWHFYIGGDRVEPTHWLKLPPMPKEE